MTQAVEFIAVLSAALFAGAALDRPGDPAETPVG
jgi:hypothetical protein